MIKEYFLGKSFGPSGSIAGISLFIIGVIMVWFSLAAIMIIIIGGFIGFTSTSCHLDIRNRRVRETSNLFGVFKIGSWIPIQKDMKIKIKQLKGNWKTYSRSNRTLNLPVNEFVLILYSSENKEIMTIMKNKKIEIVRNEAKSLANDLPIHYQK